MNRVFLAVALFTSVISLAGCEFTKGARLGYNSLGYDSAKYSTTLSKVDTGTTEVQHFRAVVIAKDGSSMPQIEGSVINIPGGKQADFIIR